MIELSKEYNIVQLTELRDFYNENETYINFAVNIDHQHFFFTKEVIEFIDEISHYGDNALIPKIIAERLKRLKLSPSILEERYEDQITINPKNNSLVVNIKDKHKDEIVLPYIMVDVEEDSTSKTPNPRDNEYVEKLQNRVKYVSIIYKHFIHYLDQENVKNTPYYSWSNFRSELKEIRVSIIKWLKDNQVKDINLPNLE